ncbi:MAG: hypothetical protein PVI26_02635 [Chitinispirillia bacterium]|jgi:hypothetical protein
MLLAIPVYKNSVAPFFDNTRVIICGHFRGTEEISRAVTDISTINSVEKALFVKNLHPHIFICNSLSLFWYNYFCANKIEIFPFVYGEIDIIFELYKNKSLKKKSFQI